VASTGSTAFASISANCSGVPWRYVTVEPDGFAGGQAACGADEQEPAPAADVEHHFIAAPRDQLKHLVADAELTDLAVVDHATGT